MEHEDYEDESEIASSESINAANTVSVSIDFSREELLESVSSRLADMVWNGERYGGDGLPSRIREKVAKEVADRVERAAQAVIDESVSVIVADMVTNGWPVTDSYGNAHGRKTLSQFVIGYLDNRGDYGRESVKDKVTKQFVEQAMGELKPEISALKEHLRSAYNAEAGKRIHAAIAEALGVKP